MPPAASYFLRYPACGPPMHRLFCFPPAGVGAGSFLGWRKFLPPQFELVAIQLPGRENRLREPPCSDLSQAIADIVTEMAQLPDLPGSCFGHSFGALLAYECCIALRRAGRPLPTHLVVSGANPPNWPSGVDPASISGLAVARLMACFGWKCAEEVDQGIASAALQVLLGDLDMMQRHRFAEEPLPMPFTVLGATDDPIVSTEALRRWTVFSRSHELSLTTGGHFFFEAQAERIVARLVEHAARIHGPDGFSFQRT